MKKILAASVVLLLVIGAGLLHVWAKAPSVSKLQKSDVKGATTESSSTTVVVNDYFSMSLPVKYVLKTQNKGNGTPLLLQQLYAVPVLNLATIASDQLAVTVKNTQGQTLKDMSDVVMRARSANYKSVTIAGLPSDVIAYVASDDGNELGIFMVRDTTYVSFVMTSTTSSMQDMQKEVQKLVRSVVWQ